MKKNLLLAFLLLQSAFCFSATITPANQIICAGSSQLLILHNAIGDTIQWEMSVDNIIWIPIAGGVGSDTFLNTPLTAIQTCYRAAITYMGNVSYSSSSCVEIASTPVVYIISYSASTITVGWTSFGTGNYTVSWTGAAIGTQTFATSPYNITGPLMPCSTINITVTLATPACPGVNPGVLTFTPPQIVATETHIDATCGNNDGSISLTLSSGLPPYSFLWNTGATTQNLSNLSAGNYSVTVNDAAGCSQQTSVSILSLLNSSLSETHVAANCLANNGSIDLSVAGLVLPIVYLWSNGSTTEDLLNISSGIYSVTVTDANSCQAILNLILPDVNGIVLSETHQNSTCNLLNGSIDLLVSGGTFPFTYFWSNGATTEDINNIFSGIYSVTTTDLLGCVSSVSVIVNDTTNLSFAISSHRIGCTNTGTVFPISLNGVGPYTFLWNTGATTDSLVGIMGGFYSVTITDAIGCSVTHFTSVFFYLSVYANGTNPTCSSLGLGYASCVSGGYSPYSYLWSNGQTTLTALGLSVGNYSVTVTDVTGCTTSGNFTLTFTPTNNIIMGKLFSDTNGNCNYDAGETGLSSFYVIIQDTSGSYINYATTDTDGNYFASVPNSGTYIVEPDFYYSSSCGPFTICGGGVDTVVFVGQCDSSITNFGFGGITGFDLTVEPNCTIANPGFQKIYTHYFNNYSPINFTDTATIIFTYDTALVYQYSQWPFPIADTTAHTLTWSISNLQALISSGQNFSSSYFLVPASVPLTYLLSSDFKILPEVGDCDTFSNHIYFLDSLTSSYDPNSKQVSPEGNISTADSVLTYTIHFQNTGTDTTNFVIVTDTLSPYLNPLTVENIFSSHPITDFTISGTGILKWVFNPVFLVDSASNEAASQGFITFKIITRKNLPFGTMINNSASIYFDYNVPVITNTVSSAIINSVQKISENKISVVAYPNPMIDVTEILVNGINGEYAFELQNVLGEKMNEVTKINATHFSFKRNSLPAGIYFYSIHQSGKNVAAGKLIME